MSELINPYIAGAPVTETRMFFGREDVFDWIQNSLSGRYADHILVIHGQRRVGKTSVLKQLGNRLPEKYIPVFFDLQGRTHTTLDRFLWWLARETVRVLKQDRNIEVPVPEKEEFARDPEHFENTFLPGLRPLLGKNNLLYTFDEFDNLEESEVKEELARPLIDHLRRLMGREEMSFIFSIGSSGRKLENMQAAYTEFFKTALYKKISFLSEEQTHNLVTHPVEGLLEYERAAVEHIYELASGHPYFTQLTCHELFARCQRTDQRRVKDEDVNAVLDDVVERGTVNLKFTWDEASDIEKWGLAALAQLDKADNRILADYLRKQRVRFSDPDLTSGLLHLREKDILTSENRFVIYLLKLWLQKNRPIEQVREELTEVNPIANRYIEIGQEFKDTGQFDKAIESFQEALAIAPENIQAQVNIALAYIDQQAYDKAVIAFERALEIDDEDVVARAGLCDVHLALGDAAMEKGRTKNAVQSYRRVLDINKEHLEARQRMADISRQQAEKALTDGKDEEALSTFAEALKYTPEDPDLIGRVEQVRAEKKARVLARLAARSEKEAKAHNWERAIAILNEALDIAPEEQSILEKIESLKTRQLQERLAAILTKADQAEKASRWETAIAALNEYLKLKPGDVSIQKRLSGLVEARRAAWLNSILARCAQAVSNEQWDEALAALNEVLALEPENVEIQAKVTEVRERQRKARLETILRQADLASQAGKWDEAISALNEGLASEPGNEQIQRKLTEAREARRSARLEAVIRLADSSAQAGKWEIAIQSLNDILAVEPENEQVQKKLVEVQTRQRENQLETLRTQARFLAKTEKFEEALSAWQQYLALEPEDPKEAQREIASVQQAQMLAKAYSEAQKAYAQRNYDETIGLLKEVIDQDVDYKDASLLLAQAIELRRASPKWWQSKWLWGAIGVVALLAVAWGVLRSGSPLFASPPSPPPEVTATTSGPLVPPVPADTAAPTSTPTPLPFIWTRLNSGQFLPRDTITAIVVDPTDPWVMYVGSKNAGVYKSIDSGISWQPIHAGLGRATINSLIMDPRDPKILYAGTLLGGIYKTIDGGLTWKAMNAGVGIPGHEWLAIVVMDQQDSQHLYFTDAGMLYETIDGGQSWHEAKSRESCPRSLVGLVVDPSDGNVLYAAEFGESECQGGVYQSSDSGKTWIITGLRTPFTGIPFGGLWIDPRDGQILFKTTQDGLWVSSDRGDVWNQSNNSGCNALIFDIQDPLTAFCSTWDTILKTTNGGKRWNTIAKPSLGQAISLALSLQDQNTLYLGGAGLSISTDGGRTWNDYGSGLGGSQVELKIPPAGSSVLFAQALNQSIYLTEDGGRNWSHFGSGRNVLFDDEGENAYILNENNNLAISKDNGESWEQSALPLPDAYPHAIAVHPTIPNRVYALYGRNTPPYVYYSDDLGITWQATTGMRDSHNPRLFFDHDQGQRVYAIGDLEASRSDDAGVTWQNCGDFPSMWTSITDTRAVVDWRDRDRLTVATRGNGIIISDDGCRIWKTSNAGLGSFFVNTLTIDPNNPSTYYAATDGGAYVSLDGGKTWNQINDGLLGATVVYSIAVDKDSSVYAATPYGIFKLEGK